MNLQSEYDSWHQQVGKSEPAAAELSHPWHRTVAKLLPDLTDRRVLEIGCGRGDFARWMVRRYPSARITAVDFSEAAIELAKARAAEAADAVCFEVGDATALRFENGAFDMVVSCECLEHIPKPERMAQEIHRVLVKGGRFILTTENYCNGTLLAWFQSWLTGRPFNSGSGVQPHENFFLFWRVKRLLEKGGLVVNHMESNHFQWLLLPRTDPARLCTRDFKSPFWKKLFRPFGRHFTFCGFRP